MVQIVVPMAGFGERFRAAGYRIPKPLIRVDGQPMVAHAVAPFPSSARITFVCNEDHLANTEFRMAPILEKLNSEAQIVGIPSHHLGPSHSVAQVLDRLEPDIPTVVNYCDFSSSLKFQDLSKAVSTNSFAGSIACYRGFHPHSLRSTNYAYVREREGRVQEVREKMPFTEDPTSEFASSGTYYFESASLLADALEYQFDNDLSVGGEFFTSLAFRFLLDANLPIGVFPVEHFSQWGTPQDLDDYRVWSRGFIDLSYSDTAPDRGAGTLLLTMAGQGSRFTSEGFKTAKPLIEISGTPMFRHAINSLPAAEQTVIVAQASQIQNSRQAFEDFIPLQSHVVELKSATLGQAVSAAAGLDRLEAESSSVSGPLIVSAADSAYGYDPVKFSNVLDNAEADIVVWGFRGHPGAKLLPESYSWVSHIRGSVKRILVKQAPEDSGLGFVVTSCFVFKNPSSFRAALKSLISDGADLSGELSMDHLINHAIDLGFRCELFEVDHFYSWGTPQELKIFEYWKRYFGADKRHPYDPDTDKLSTSAGGNRAHGGL